MMRADYLFAEPITIHDVVEHQKRQAHQALEGLLAEKILTNSLDAVTAELAQTFRLDVPVLDRAGTVQLPNEEIDIDVSRDWARVFHTPGPHYVKGTALRIAIPFHGEAELFRYGSSPYNSPIPGEIRDETVVLTYSAEHPDAAAARADFENRIGQIESALQMIRGPADEWNRQLRDMIRSRLQNRRAKLERDQGLALGYPPAPTKVAVAPPQRAIEPKAGHFDLFLSYASEDKEAIARPLYTALVAAGVSVWFDEAVLELGDSLSGRSMKASRGLDTASSS